MPNQKPAAEFRFGAIKATVWRNETQNGPMFNSVIVRVYKDKDGNWQESTSMGRDDLLVQAFAARRCFEFVCEQQAAAKTEAA